MHVLLQIEIPSKMADVLKSHKDSLKISRHLLTKNFLWLGDAVAAPGPFQETIV